jgi:hypothetical protein
MKRHCLLCYPICAIKLIHILPQAGGLRYCTAAAFSSLKKYATHFFNFAFGSTEEKEAAHAVAGVNLEKYLLKPLILDLSLYL